MNPLYGPVTFSYYPLPPFLFVKSASASSNAKSIQHDCTDKAKTGAVVEPLTKALMADKLAASGEDGAWYRMFTITVEECTN